MSFVSGTEKLACIQESSGSLNNSKVQAITQTNESTLSGGGPQAPTVLKPTRMIPVCRQVQKALATLAGVLENHPKYSEKLMLVSTPKSLMSLVSGVAQMSGIFQSPK